LLQVMTQPRHNRVAVTIPLEVTGVDLDGKLFAETGQTISVSQAGASIRLDRKLAPEQEITVRNLAVGNECDARVLGRVSGNADQHTYAIALLGNGGTFWGINFPPLVQSENVAARLLMECTACRAWEIVELDELETQVLNHSLTLSRHCQRCKDQTLWKESFRDPGMPLEPGPSLRPPRPRREPPPPPPAPPRSQNERKKQRVGIKMPVCIRFAQFSDEITISTDVSRGGFSFLSAKWYQVGSRVEVCLPFQPGEASIFIAAQIRHARRLHDKNLTKYGVKFLDAEEAAKIPSSFRGPSAMIP
jgi:PilZ domain